MASAMSSLRKTRKMPLSSVPFRDSLPSVETTESDSRLLDEVTSNMAATRLRGTKSPANIHTQRHTDSPTKLSTSISKVVPSDNELMSLMSYRLSQLETKLQYQAKEIVEKDKIIQIQQEKLKLQKKLKAENTPGRVTELENKCYELQQQIHQMEAFLADYGMIWVGNDTDSLDTHRDDVIDDVSSSSRLTPGGVWNPATSLPSSEFPIDFDLIVRNVKDLNVLAGEGVSMIHHTNDGARLKMPDPVQLTLYSNGVVMFSGPFRPFSDSSTQRLVQDILDGYFPSELQSRYADGVPFKLTDKRDVHFRDKKSEVFQGAGQSLGGERGPSRLLHGTQPTHTVRKRSAYREEHELPGPKISAEKFLSNLPKSVIKNGKVIDIRKSLGDTLKISGPGLARPTVIVAETPVVQQMNDRFKADESGVGDDASITDITTLRIKSEHGDQTYILKLKFTDTITNVRKYIDRERPGTSTHYQIMSAFPQRVYEDGTATLQQCGLTPNATLHLRQLR